MPKVSPILTSPDLRKKPHVGEIRKAAARRIYMNDIWSRVNFQEQRRVLWTLCKASPCAAL